MPDYKNVEWHCPDCGETASGPQAGVDAVAARHKEEKHPSKKADGKEKGDGGKD